MQKPHKHVSPEEFLLFESTSKTKHEYVDGEVFAMAGGTQAHSLISTNITSILKSKLKGSDCRVHGSDLLVRVESTNSFYYPDAMVDCGTYEKGSSFTKTPALVFEVVSRSTAATDRREKLVGYKSISSLKAYVIVQQTRKHIEIFQRDAQSDWTFDEVHSTGSFELEICPGRTIKVELGDIYDQADLNESPDLQVREEAEIYSW